MFGDGHQFVLFEVKQRDQLRVDKKLAHHLSRADFDYDIVHAWPLSIRTSAASLHCAISRVVALPSRILVMRVAFTMLV